MQKAYEDKIVILNPKHIHPHPNNPRKDLGDLTELRASVKKNGIMQNLTVIPMEEQGEYMALIGHRRSEAARLEELEGVPCIIKEGLSELEQLNIMMEENMQRNDLSIYEQAQGFQMMLNLGETAESIATKSGFSVSTVYHRLNIAKLNQEELQKKEKDNSFQLSLTAIYELEKIENIETRNKVLKEATDNQNLVTRARNAVRDEHRKKAEKELIKIFEKMEVKSAPPNTSYYDTRYERVKDIDLDGKIPEEINLKGKGPFLYVCQYGKMYILKKAEKKKKTKEELKREDREKQKKQIKAIIKEMDNRRRLFILDLVSENKKSVSKEDAAKDKLWQHLVEVSAGLYRSYLIKFYTQKDTYSCTQEEKEEADKWINSLTTVQQMMVFLSQAINGMEPYNYYGQFSKDIVKKKYAAMKLFEQYGWYFTEEEQQLLDGSHELYEKEEV